MISLRMLVTSALCAAIFYLPVAAEDLGGYRDFRFGMSLESVAKQLHVDPADARTIQQRPAVIQTLQWDQYRYSQPAVKADSVRNLRFDFYSGELYKMVVTYDPAGTEGLTTDDMIEAISSVYGAATRPESTIRVSGSAVYEDNQKVLARWENAQYSYNLFRSPYGNAFGLVGFSKQIDLLASDSSREAERLDKLEAPGKEVARQIKQEEDKRAAQEKARLISKPKFRP